MSQATNTVTGGGRRVVILGCGHAGLAAARRLRQLAARQGFQIVVASRDTALLWHGLLPQVISNAVQPQDTLVPLRKLLPGVAIYPYEVESVDLPGRRVSLSRGPERPPLVLDYDHLVLALGSVTDLSRFAGLDEHGLQVKTVGDAFNLRNHLLEMLELASVEPDVEERRRLLTFAVAGAGFAGVEVCAELNALVRGSLRFYPRIDPREVQVVLLSAEPRILAALEPALAARAQRWLEQNGVQVRLSTGLAAATATSAVLSDGEHLPTRTLVATVGVGPNPVLAALPLPLARGRISCDRYCRVPGWSGVYAAGDCAAVPDEASGQPFPATAPSAAAQGRAVAENILAQTSGTDLVACSANPPQLALLGPAYGLVQFGRIRLDGVAASLVWRLAWLDHVTSMRRRLGLLLDWAVSGAFPPDPTRVPIARTDGVLPMRFERGEVILRQGDPPSRFYILTEGEVEVVQRTDAGEETVVATLGPGEYFGEVALLHGTNRIASVRAKTDVMVLGIPKQEFRPLVGHLAALRDSLQVTADAREGAG